MEDMSKIHRVALCLAAVILVALTLVTVPAEAAFCRPANFIAWDEYHCADYCHARNCIYSYDPEASECWCTFP